MKKKLLVISIATIICFLLGTLTEVLFFNFRSIFPGDSKTIPSISYETTTKDNIVTNTINTEGHFVRKLVIEYEAEETIPFDVTYKYSAEYGKEDEKTVSDIFEKQFNRAILNLEERTSKIEISYNAEKNCTIKQVSIDNDFHFNPFRFLFFSLAFLTVFFLVYFYKAGFKTERLHIYFFVIGALLGTMFLFSRPASNHYAWDDQIHFERVVGFFSGTVHFNSGEFHSTNANIIDSAGKYAITSAEEQFIQNELLSSNTDYQYNQGFGLYTPYGRLPYLPMAIGYHSAKLFNLPFTACFYIGKIFNLLFYLLLIAYAIKTIRTGKLLLAIIGLLPSNLFLATSYTYDPAVFAGITVFIAHIVNLFIDKKEKVTFKTLLIMIASITYACVAKPPYAPLLLLALFISASRFELKTKYVRYVKIGLGCIALLLTSLVVWNAINGGSLTDSRGGETSLVNQAKLIITHPLDATNVMNKNIGTKFLPSLASSDALSNFAYMGTLPNSCNVYYIILILIIFAAITNNKNNTLSKKYRLIIFISMLTIIGIIWGSLYLTFTPVGSNVIAGVQFRYFLPLLFPLLLSIQPSKITNSFEPKKYNIVLLSIMTIATIVIIYSMVLLRYSF